MSEFPKTVSRHILAGALIVTCAPAFAQSPPDFSSNNTAWVSMGGDWVAQPGGPPPVTFDPAHPYVPNNIGKQPTFRVADLSNPNLTAFAKESLKKSNEEVLAGKAMYNRESRCWATGVPVYLFNPAQPTFWLQTPQKVAMIWQMDQQIRHVYLNVPHSQNPKPTWYGESVGRYEDDALLIDTIGQDTRTFLDNYRTPHSDKLHVTERYHLIDGGKAMQADVVVDDPATFIQPLRVIHRWRRVEGTLVESRCADGEMRNPFKQDVEPIPTAHAPDF